MGCNGVQSSNLENELNIINIYDDTLDISEKNNWTTKDLVVISYNEVWSTTQCYLTVKLNKAKVTTLSAICNGRGEAEEHHVVSKMKDDWKPKWKRNKEIHQTLLSSFSWMFSWHEIRSGQ